MSSTCDPFSHEQLAQIEAQTFVRHVQLHEELPSTNDWAIQLAAAETTATPLLVLTRRQSHGRGRGTKPWWSSDGSLTFSLLMEWPDSNSAGAPPPQVALAAGVSLCGALQELVPGLCPQLKWPNDVFLNGRKLAGILVEVPCGRQKRMVVGVGVNVNNTFDAASAEQKQIAISLVDATGCRHCRVRLLILFLKHLEQDVALLKADMPRLARRWRSYCMLQGRTISCRQGRYRIHGTCRHIDDQGALLVETASGVQRVISGQVRIR